MMVIRVETAMWGLTIIHINRHGDLVQHSKSIFKGLVVSCKDTIIYICIFVIHAQTEKRIVSRSPKGTSANYCSMILLVNESFSNMKHLTSYSVTLQ